MTRKTPECRRVLAKLRLRRMMLKRANKYSPRNPDIYVASSHTDVQRTWRRHGWQPIAREAA